MKTVLSIKGISAVFAGKTALDSVNLSLERGKILSIIGPNGAGKSTLLKCIIRLVVPSAGSIEVMGRPSSGLSVKMIARTIAYIPQSQVSDVPFTVRQYILTGRYPHFSFPGGPGPADHKKVTEIMERFGLSPFADRLVNSLSGGERQKVTVAAAMAQEPSILLLDELTTFLDPRHQAEILSMILDSVRENGTAVLSATHDLNSASMISDSMVALKNGSILWQLPAAEAMNRDRLGEVFDCGIRLIEDTGKVPIALVDIPGINQVYGGQS